MRSKLHPGDSVFVVVRNCENRSSAVLILLFLLLPVDRPANVNVLATFQQNECPAYYIASVEFMTESLFFISVDLLANKSE